MSENIMMLLHHFLIWIRKNVPSGKFPDNPILKFPTPYKTAKSSKVNPQKLTPPNPDFSTQLNSIKKATLTCNKRAAIDTKTNQNCNDAGAPKDADKKLRRAHPESDKTKNLSG
jgi:hypothetical protein